MKLRQLLSLTLLAGALLAGQAQASDLLYETKPARTTHLAYSTGPYISAHAGANYQGGITGYVSPTTGGTADLSTGYDASAALGWKMGGLGWFSPRLEVEGFYLKNNLDSVQVFNAGGPVGAPVGVTGDYSAMGLFANALFDFEMGLPITPFIGGGVGYADVSVDATAPGPGNFLNDSDGAFAWNLTAGASYAITENTSFDVAYRFVRFQGVSLQGTPPLTVNEDIDNHQVNAGFRIKL